MKISSLFLGYSIPEIDRFMDDLEALHQYGPSHRIFRHNTSDLMFIRDNYGIKCFHVGLLHLLVDLKVIDGHCIKQLEEWLP